MHFEPLFVGKDLELIESLVYDPNLAPSFDIMRGCLVWQDERPAGLSPTGRESLIDLWCARSFLHQGRDFSEHRLDPEYFRKIWERALSQAFKWPGFNRLTLTEADKTYYESELKKSAKVEDY
jgi:hypothetical protein